MKAYVIRQFDQTRFIKHFFAFPHLSISGIAIWRPLFEWEIWDFLILGRSKCNWRNNDFNEWLFS